MQIFAITDYTIFNVYLIEFSFFGKNLINKAPQNHFETPYYSITYFPASEKGWKLRKLIADGLGENDPAIEIAAGDGFILAGHQHQRLSFGMRLDRADIIRADFHIFINFPNRQAALRIPNENAVILLQVQQEEEGTDFAGVEVVVPHQNGDALTGQIGSVQQADISAQEGDVIGVVLRISAQI